VSRFCRRAGPPPPNRPPDVLYRKVTATVNFKKLLLIVIPVAVLIVGYQWMTRVDRSNPVEVATAFTKHLKAGNNSKAAKYYVPDQAEEWEQSVTYMKSGARDRFRERIPAEPAFGAPVTTAAGVTTISSADKLYLLEMKQVDGKWYVAKVPG
jgi:hypothetical protein